MNDEVDIRFSSVVGLRSASAGRVGVAGLVRGGAAVRGAGRLPRRDLPGAQRPGHEGQGRRLQDHLRAAHPAAVGRQLLGVPPQIQCKL